MIGTNKTESKSIVKEREYEVDEPEPAFYTEKETHLLYEVKLFPDFALIRLIMPDVQLPVHRIDIMTFTELFEEYNGDLKELRSILFGSKPSSILISKSNKHDGDE